MVERTEREGNDGVMIQVSATAGDHIRHPGGDVTEGDLVFTAGAVLSPAHLGVLASLGFAEVPALVEEASIDTMVLRVGTTKASNAETGFTWAWTSMTRDVRVSAKSP